MLPAKLAKQDGYSEVLYVDAKESKYIEEVGAANFFCIKGNKILSPELDGSILPGITRRSILQLAQEKFGLEAEEKKVSVEEVLEADELFASGTAAIISPIGLINFEGKDYTFNNGEVGTLTTKIYKTLIAIQHGLQEDPYGWVYKI